MTRRRVGRPPGIRTPHKDNQGLTVRKQIRLTPEQWEQVEKAAGGAELEPGTWMREVVVTELKRREEEGNEKAI